MKERRDVGPTSPARASYLAANDGAGLVVVPMAELIAAIREAVGESRGDAAPEPRRLLDRSALAEALSCSPSLVGKLRREGMPCLYVGDSPRFVLADCLRWIADRPLPAASAKETA